MRSRLHVAGEPIALVQRCARCERVLVANGRPRFFPSWQLVEGRGRQWRLLEPMELPGDDVRARLCEARA